MAYNILGINPFHNGSAALISDGKLIYYLEEERLSKTKRDAEPFRVILDILDKYNINEIVLAGININDTFLSYSFEPLSLALIRKFYPKRLLGIPCYSLSDHHHLIHSYHSFLNSGYNQAISIVLDNGGSLNNFNNIKGEEMDSIFIWDKEKNVERIFCNMISEQQNTKKYSLGIGGTYGAVTTSLGFVKNSQSEGKIMGLSSYGNKNSKFKFLFNNNESDNNLIYDSVKNSKKYKEPRVELDKILTYYNKVNNTNINLSDIINNEWHNNPSKITSFHKDFSYHLQNQCQQVVKNYISKYTKKTGIKNVVCSGGYFLNCVSNYYLIKEFPNINFYFEPISHDGGTAIGAAYWRWLTINPNFNFQKNQKIYLGPQYTKKQLIKGIKKYL